MTTTAIIVQARTGSTRLPGKVLAPVAGRPMLAFLLERLRRVRSGPVVVATSDLPGDDTVADVARAAGVAVVRGPEQDVLRRFRIATEAHPSDVIVRITADCPLTDPAVVDDVVRLRGESGATYASNTLVRTYPVGLDVEAFTSDALRTADDEATAPAEREHVTPFIYRNTSRFRLVPLRTDLCLGAERWTVDTAEDLERVRSMVAKMADPVSAGWRDILAVAPPHDHRDEYHLVPAVRSDADAIKALDTDPQALRLGGVGAPPTIEQYYGDASSRLWVLRSAGKVQGWYEIEVRDGHGRLRGVAVDPAADTHGRRCLQALFKADYQFVTLEPDIRGVHGHESAGNS
jgi:spore coat polysaccharide biosynthesis protein SpsF